MKDFIKLYFNTTELKWAASRSLDLYEYWGTTPEKALRNLLEGQGLENIAPKVSHPKDPVYAGEGVGMNDTSKTAPTSEAQITLPLRLLWETIGCLEAVASLTEQNKLAEHMIGLSTALREVS